MNPSEKIKHLYMRAGFGWSPEEWKSQADWSLSQADWSLSQAVNHLFEQAGLVSSLPEDDSLSDLLAGMIRQLSVEVEDDLSLLFLQRALGQVLFNPPNVAGWRGGRS